MLRSFITDDPMRFVTILVATAALVLALYFVYQQYRLVYPPTCAEQGLRDVPVRWPDGYVGIACMK